MYAKGGHSKFVEINEDSSDFYRSASKSDWYFICTHNQVNFMIYLSNCLHADRYER